MDNGKIFTEGFEKIFSYKSLFSSWLEFRNGKREKSDVTDFAIRVSKYLFDLRNDILSGNYSHGGYKYFRIYEPKVRDIHKASVRDRVIHHAIYRATYPYFDRYFVHDSYSCRLEKGTHRALQRFSNFARKESNNNTRTIWVLKGDIRKCFASIDHNILKKLIGRHIKCPKIISIINVVIDSFSSVSVGKGIPLGNLTSQLFVNVYLNEFDHYIKRILKVKKYIRYADDFVVFSYDRHQLELLVPKIRDFLKNTLSLELHPDKVFIRTWHSGVDFLGWVHFPKHRILRKSTKISMYQNIFPETREEVVASYFGLLNYGNSYKIKSDLCRRLGRPC
ncbi:MAG: reverse transcriptase/maturase family protein [Candidatus Paceibacterota bacterium]|jgi:retron-type reverse transcriptase